MNQENLAPFRAVIVAEIRTTLSVKGLNDPPEALVDELLSLPRVVETSNYTSLDVVLSYVGIGELELRLTSDKVDIMRVIQKHESRASS